MEHIKAKNILYKTKTPWWFGTDYNINIYKGCNFGCIYCDSRSECYRINDFGNIKAKENALQIIRNDIKRKVKKGVIATGSMSDPYNKIEEKENLTRSTLEYIDTFGFGVAITTKSTLIERDIEILKKIQKHSPVIVKMTITTYNNELCKKIEKNVESSSRRFEVLKKLSDEGIYAGILLMPILPFINDYEENILNIVKEGKKAGVKFIYPSFGVTLRDNQREYFYNMLEGDKNFVGIKEKYIKTYRNKYNCFSPKYKQLNKVFREKCDEVGILYNMNDIIQSYKKGYGGVQLNLFDN